MTDYADFTLLQTGQQVQDILNRGQYAVTYSSDSAYVMSDAQKAQARNNIGAVDVADMSILQNTVVKHVSQSLTDEQKTQARTNIDAASVGDIEDLEVKKADVDGNYPEMTVGTAESLIGDLINEDDATYLMRPTPVDAKRKSVKVTGATVAWNQLCPDNRVSEFSKELQNGYDTVNVSNMVYTIKDHVYFYYLETKADFNGDGTTQYRIGAGNASYSDIGLSRSIVMTENYAPYRGIFKITNPNNREINNGLFVQRYSSATFDANHKPTVYEKYANLYDLTRMFGSTIADALYAMEQAQAGSGIAFLKSHGFFLGYEDYDAGSLKSVNVTEHKVTRKNFAKLSEDNKGSNQNSSVTYTEDGATVTATGTYGRTGWAIPLVKGQTYTVSADCIASDISAGHLNRVYLSSRNGVWNDGDEGGMSYWNVTTTKTRNTYTFTAPSSVLFIGVYVSTTASNGSISLSNVQVELGSTATSYEPYEEHTYALDAKTTENPSGDLRGLFKIVNGELVADGDEYTSDGKVARRYGIVDLGTLTYTYNSTYAMFAVALSGASRNTNNIVCAKYVNFSSFSDLIADTTKNGIFKSSDANHSLYIRDTAYSDPAAFKTAMSGVYLVYEKATPTEEQATPYADPMICLKDGTEEWDSPIPVYTEADYFDAVTSEDIKAIQSELTEKIYDTLPTDKIENAPIATFPDGADNVPVKSATFAIAPVQDLHGYDAPWPAGGGKNKLPNGMTSETSSGVSITVGNDGTITLNNTATANFNKELASNLSLPAGEYVFTGIPTNGKATFFYTINGGSYTYYNKNMPDGRTITIANGDVIDTVRISITSGDSFSNEVYKPMIRLSTEADATFAPYSNICPITGFTGAEITDRGVNLWNEEWEVRAYSATTGAKTASNECIRSKDYIPIKPNAALYGYYGKVGDGLFALFYDKDKNYISINGQAINITNKVFTTPSNAFYMNIRTFASGVTTNVYENNISINYPSTDTAYHASVGATKDITWSGAAGTVYGGTLEYLGGDAWRLTKTMENVDMGTLPWMKSSSGNNFYASISPLYDYGVDVTMLCSQYVNAGARVSPPYYGNDKKFTYFLRGLQSPAEIYVHDEAYSDAVAFKTAMSGVQLVYELATPVVYDLTGEELATVLGNNNVFSNTGDVTELVYRADTALYIQKMIANALNA